jgi:outer membrane receptor for ferrienterochelin and colicins
LQVELRRNSLYAQAGGSYTRFLQGAGSLNNSTQATLQLQYALSRQGVSLSSFLKYNGRQPNIELTAGGGSAYNGHLAAYTLWDASIEKSFWKKRVTLIVGLKNLLDVKQIARVGAQSGGVHSGNDPSSSISPGRSLFSSLNLQF